LSCIHLGVRSALNGSKPPVQFMGMEVPHGSRTISSRSSISRAQCSVRSASLKILILAPFPLLHRVSSCPWYIELTSNIFPPLLLIYVDLQVSPKPCRHSSRARCETRSRSIPLRRTCLRRCSPERRGLGCSKVTSPSLTIVSRSV
jgi:hypothetical protein